MLSFLGPVSGYVSEKINLFSPPVETVVLNFIRLSIGVDQLDGHCLQEMWNI